MIRKVLSAVIAFIFSVTTILPPSYAQIAGLNLPSVGAMVNLSPAFAPVLLKGMTIHPDNPLQFDFIIDSGNTNFQEDRIKSESERLVKYFLASMTIPKDDLWVNLSPYESDRIIPEELGKTELGRDMLAQDYILKQLTASLMYPEKELGKEFWTRIYAKAKEKFGTTEIPVDTFNKVWILPATATVYEHGQTVYIVEAKLRVMLDSDYEAQKGEPRSSMLDARSPSSIKDPESSIETEIVREIILPEIEKEVNEGQNFAPLRQIYHSLILAKWYKETVKNSLLSKIYIDQKKIAGVDTNDPTIKDQIYAQYMEAYKKGVFNYIKEDYDKLSQEAIPRKYFSGGEELAKIPLTRTKSGNPIKESDNPKYRIEVSARPQKQGTSSPLTEAEARAMIKAKLQEKYGRAIDDSPFYFSLITETHLREVMRIYERREPGKKFDFDVLYHPAEYESGEWGAINVAGGSHDSGYWPGPKISDEWIEIREPKQSSSPVTEDEARAMIETKLVEKYPEHPEYISLITKEDIQRVIAYNGKIDVIHYEEQWIPKGSGLAYWEYSWSQEEIERDTTPEHIEIIPTSSPIFMNDLLDVPAGLIGALEEKGRILSVKTREVFDIGFGEYWNQIQEFAGEHSQILTISGLLAAAAAGTGGLYYYWSRYTLSGNLYRLQNSDYDVRQSAVEALKRMDVSREQMVEGYLKALGSSDSDVRRFAAEALGELGDTRAVEPLITRLADSDYNVRQSVVEALKRMDVSREQMVEGYLKALGSSDFDVRRFAAEALGRLGDARTVEPLIARLADSDSNVRRSVALALGQLGDARTVEPLIARLADPKSNVRRFVAEALGQLADVRAFEPLIVRLADSDSDVRRSVVLALGQLGDTRAVEPLIARLADSDSNVRQSAVLALGQLGDTRAVEPLIARLTDSDSNVRRSVALALGQLGDTRAVEPLIKSLSDSGSAAHSTAAQALGKLGDTRAVEPLIKCLSDFDSAVRSTAAQALGKLGDTKAVEPLETLLKNTPKTFEYEETGPYGESWGTRIEDNLEYSAIENALKKLRGTPGQSSSPIESGKLNSRLVNEWITNKKIDPAGIKDERLKKFLVFLRENNLTDIVVMGGAIKSLLFDEEAADIDISVKMDLTDTERASLEPLAGAANQRIYKQAVESIRRLAEAMGVESSAFLPPSRGLTKAFEGLNIDYFGPIATSNGVIVKRSIFDAVSKKGYFTNTAAGLLRFAIDGQGNIYGDVESLKDLLQGKLTIQGDGTNFGINDVLRVLRIKHQYGLEISDKDYQLLKTAMARYKNRLLPPVVLEVTRDQVQKLLTGAVNKEAAQQELEAFGISRLIDQSSSPVEVADIHVDWTQVDGTSDGIKVNDDIFTYDISDNPIDIMLDPVFKKLMAQLKDSKVSGLNRIVEKFEIHNNKLSFWPNQTFDLVLRELLSNAYYYSDYISISIKAEIDSQGRFVLIVSDKGKGLGELDKEKIFEKGFTIREPKRKDAGTGLYMSRIFVREIIGNGADIYAYDNQRDLGLSESGATFKVIIPFASSPAESSQSGDEAGSNRNISRRDFLWGAAVAALGLCMGGCDILGSDSNRNTASGTNLPKNIYFPKDWKRLNPYITDVDKSITDRGLSFRISDFNLVPDISGGMTSIRFEYVFEITNVGSKPIALEEVQSLFFYDNPRTLGGTRVKFLLERTGEEEGKITLKPQQTEKVELSFPNSGNLVPSQVAILVKRLDGQDTALSFVALERLFERSPLGNLGLRKSSSPVIQYENNDVQDFWAQSGSSPMQSDSLSAKLIGTTVSIAFFAMTCVGCMKSEDAPKPQRPAQQQSAPPRSEPEAPRKAPDVFGDIVSTWVKDLGSSSESQLTQSMQNLIKMGLPAVPALRKGLISPNPQIRSNAAATLSFIKPQDGATVEALKNAINDSNVNVRYNTLVAIAKIAPYDEVLILELTLLGDQDPDADVRKAAKAAAWQVSSRVTLPSLIQKLDMEPSLELAKVVRRIVDTGEMAIPLLSQVIKDKSQNQRRRDNAVFALGHIKPVTPEMKTIFKYIIESPDFDEMKADNVARMAENGIVSEEMLDTLIQFLNDLRPALRGNTAAALRVLGTKAKSAEKRLREIVVSDSELTARINSILTLGNMGSVEPETEQVLRTIAGSPQNHPELRRAARYSLKELGLRFESDEPQATPEKIDKADIANISDAATLLRIAVFSDEESQELAYKRIVALGKDMIPDLIKAIENIDVAIRTTAVRAIGDIGEVSADDPSLQGFTIFQLSSATAAVPHLILALEGEDDYPFDLAVVQSLGKIGPEAEDSVGAIIGRLNHRETLMRYTAVEALGRIAAEDELVLPLLLDKTHDPVSAVRIASVNAISRFARLSRALGAKNDSVKGVATALLNALQNQDEDVREEALKRLGGITSGIPGAVDKLLNAIKSSVSPAVRFYAAQVLGQMGAEAESALDPLVKAHNIERDPQVKQMMKSALSKIAGAIVEKNNLDKSKEEKSDNPSDVQLMLWKDSSSDASSSSLVAIKAERQKLFADLINKTQDNNLGGIDMNDINVDRQGAGVDIQFDTMELQEIIDAGGIDGFAPVIINITPLPSVLPLLGLEPGKREEELAVSAL